MRPRYGRTYVSNERNFTLEANVLEFQCALFQNGMSNWTSNSMIKKKKWSRQDVRNKQVKRSNVWADLFFCPFSVLVSLSYILPYLYYQIKPSTSHVCWWNRRRRIPSIVHMPHARPRFSRGFILHLPNPSPVEYPTVQYPTRPFQNDIAHFPTYPLFNFRHISVSNRQDEKTRRFVRASAHLGARRTE